MLIIDAHLDLSMNALQWNRDLIDLGLHHPNSGAESVGQRPRRGNGLLA
jgi:hypothetical protein